MEQDARYKRKPAVPKFSLSKYGFGASGFRTLQVETVIKTAFDLVF
jgi:hypothetical protein